MAQLESTLDRPHHNEAPRHGDPGQRQRLFHPPQQTVAISRETGARGASIGKLS